MIFRPFRRAPRHASIAALYGMIVAQARSRAFYGDYGVPDTVNGRLEMITLHAMLFVHRVEGEPPPVRRLGQDLFDEFCRDMDASLREMGVGDLAVPRKMRAIGEAFYGRQTAYRTALAASGQGLLAEALARNVFAVPSPANGALRLATYVREAVHVLAAQDAAAFSSDELRFPDPQQVAVAGEAERQAI
jgi:cytochrome b pre-mRNA-processing protein 3